MKQILCVFALCGVIFGAESYNKNTRLEFYDFSQDTLYATISRGNLIEDIYAPQVAIEAVKNKEEIPLDTTISLVEFKNSKANLNRYIIMRKTREGWIFEEFLPNKKVNLSEDTKRCFSCHANNISGKDIVFTLDKMRAFR